MILPDGCPICDAEFHGRRFCFACTKSWTVAGLPSQQSEHLRLELAHGRPLADTEPVPGCGCATCLTLAAGGTLVHAEHAEDVVVMLAGMPPGERVEAVTAATIELEALGARWLLPSPKVMALLAERLPGALRATPTDWRHRADDREPLPVEDARRVDILEVVRRLGLPEPQKRGREWWTTCPLHPDEHPSLRIEAEEGLWFCDPCGIGGDGLRLWELATGDGFREAVLALAGK